MKEIFEKYKTYILIGIIIILIIIIGFMYGNNITNKYEEKEEKTEEKIEEKKEKKEELNKVYVDIKGEVKVPGVYELNENERVIDVIKKANGLTDKADTSYINLSKKLKDEMVVIIYSKDEIKNYQKNLKENEIKEIIKYEVIEKELPCPNKTNEACINDNKNETTNDETNEQKNSKQEKTTNDSKVEEENTEINNDIKLVNLNTATKTDLLTLPGIGESKADLIIDYRNNNKFNSIEDIKNVKGIGDSLFEKIKDYITV